MKLEKTSLRENKTEKTWLLRQAESEAKKDVMPISERWGQAVAAAGILIVLVFFFVNQTNSTGLFTAQFGIAEAFLLYFPMVLVLLANIIRIAIGRKNIVRPFEAFAFAFVAVGMIWLYMVFPFDFSHIADVLPTWLRFVLQWISNDIARIAFVLMILGSFVFVAYTAALYVNVRRELSKPQATPTST